MTAVLAALVAVAGILGDVSVADRSGAVIAGVVAVLAVVFAVGWPMLTGLSSPVGSTVVVALAGGGAVAAVFAAVSQPYLGDVPLVFAGALLASFVAELVRRDGRERMVESVSGTVSGALVALCGAGWIAAERTLAGDAIVVAGAVALAVGAAVAAIGLRSWTGAAATVVASILGGGAVGAALGDLGLLSGVLLGLSVGILLAAADALLDRLPSLERRPAAWAAGILPVMVTGILVYVVGRVLVG